MRAIHDIFMATAAAFALAISCRAAFASASPAVIVSPAGDDAGDGSAAQPVKSLQRAQELARGVLASKRGVNVTLLAGTYRPDHTLVFTSEDSGTAEAPAVWTAAPGGDVTISGGELLDLQWEPFRDGIFAATVPADCPDDQLLVNGQIQPMARYPDYDPNQRIFNGYAADCISPARVARWAAPQGGFIHAMHPSLWGDSHYLIVGKDANGALRYEGGWQNNRPMGMHAEYRFVENIFEELDAPGEWYLDSSQHKLYFYPPAGLDLVHATVESVRLRHLIEFRGNEQAPVSNVIFKGIRFTQAGRTFMENREPLVRSDWTIYRGGALLFDGATHCSIENCAIEDVGGNAIFFSNFNRHCVIKSCHLTEIGGNGVAFVGDPKAARSPLFGYDQRQPYDAMNKGRGPLNNNYPADCVVEDCLIHRTGRVEKQTAPIEIDLAARITVRSCSIYDVPRAGINIGDGCWGGHVIEFCDIFDTVRETGDHGSFNSWGRDRYWLPGIKDVDALVAAHPELPTLDCVEPITLRNSRWRCDHGWDIDLDDGSSYYHIYNNLCLNGGIKNREGYGRVVENNVIVNNSFHPHVWYANSGDVFRRNIVFRSYQPVGLERPWGKQIDQNLLHQPGQPAGPATKLREQSGRDQTSLVGDAQFADPENGDYRVKAGSPALSLGFVNFPMDRFGVVSPELKRLARTPIVGRPAVADAAQRPDRTGQWLGIDVKNVVTLGEVSATGLSRAEGVLILRVPAEAGQTDLRANDVILQVDGKPVAGVDELMIATKNGSNPPIELSIWREQRLQKIQVRASH